MAHKTLAIFADRSLFGVVFLIYRAMTFEPPSETCTTELDTPIPRPVTTTPDPAPTITETEPAEALVEVDPVEITPAEPEADLPDAEPLPSLNASDAELFARLAEIELGASLMRLMAPDDVIRKFVVFVHNASTGELPQLDYPLRDIPSDFVATEVDENLFEMDPATHRRFDTLIDTLVSIEPQAAMSIYRAFKPLFQEAYAEIGFQEDFDAVLVRAIDQVMEVQLPEGPFQLIKPSVMFLYADTRIEDMDPVDKQLIRIGPANTAKLKERLPAYRERLQAGR